MESVPLKFQTRKQTLKTPGSNAANRGLATVFPGWPEPVTK